MNESDLRALLDTLGAARKPREQPQGEVIRPTPECVPLSRIIDGVAAANFSVAERAHIARCPFCNRALEKLAGAKLLLEPTPVLVEPAPAPIGSTPPNDSRHESQKPWPRWKALAVAAAVVVGLGLAFWRDAQVTHARDDAVAERDKLKDEWEKARDLIQRLNALGLLNPVGFGNYPDPGGRRQGFSVTGSNEVTAAGWFRFDSPIERIEVYWEPDARDAKPEVVDAQALTKPKPGDPPVVFFSLRHTYPLDGRVVRPRIRVVPRPGGEDVLRALNIGPAQLTAEATFRLTEWGIVAGELTGRLDRTTAVWVLQNGGQVRIEGKGDVTDVKDLPAGKFIVTQVNVEGNRQFTDVDVRKLRAGVPHITMLAVTSTGISDAGLVEIGQFRQMRWLYIADCRIGNAGLKHLTGLLNLDSLSVNETDITDAGLATIKELKSLTYLKLRGTKVSDAGIPHLAEMKNLKTLNLTNTDVTPAGIEKLKKALPECKFEK